MKCGCTYARTSVRPDVARVQVGAVPFGQRTLRLGFQRYKLTLQSDKKTHPKLKFPVPVPELLVQLVQEDCASNYDDLDKKGSDPVPLEGIKSDNEQKNI